jgi:hypothetical protein
MDNESDRPLKLRWRPLLFWTFAILAFAVIAMALTH